MKVLFTTSQPVTIEVLRVVRFLSRHNDAVWDGLESSLFISKDDGKWSEVTADGDVRCDCPEGFFGTRIKRVEDAEVRGHVAAVWRTATSHYHYVLIAWEDDSQSWEYVGADKGFQSQDWIPETLRGPVTVLRVSGTYGEFASPDYPDPLGAYRGVKAAWEAPVHALTGMDSASAAREWTARKSLYSNRTLESLFRSLNEHHSSSKRNARLQRKR